jgi:hypothetical protein
MGPIQNLANWRIAKHLEALVAALRLHGFGSSSISRPQLNLMTCRMPTGTDGQCCTPSTCPDDRNLQAH